MTRNSLSSERTAVLIPCFNEHKTIEKVIEDFRRELPGANIYVFDNNSTDGSDKLASGAGAIVVKEKRQGKGFVVSAMLKKVHSDVYVMVDGDDTYPASCVMSLVQPLLDERADMVVGRRVTGDSKRAFRPLHAFGNELVRRLINAIFSSTLLDPMSGYRAFTSEVARELPIVAYGFDVETEMTIQLLYRKFVISEVAIPYRDRPHGSVSKLRTFRDGFLVLGKIFSITRAYKPLTFFGGIGILLVVVGLPLGVRQVQMFLLTRNAASPYLLGLAVGCVLVGVVSAAVGLVLHTLNFRLLELSSVLSKASPSICAQDVENEPRPVARD